MSSAVAQPRRSKTLQPTIAATPQVPPLVPAIRSKPPPPPRPLHPIIEIINGYKHFGFSKKWHQVMRNVNLMAYAGQAYVLLGPHGSGKSSILDVILGFSALNNGCINVFGVRPGSKSSGCPGPRVGYTPQSNGLFKQMTINETFKYYGNMLGLKSNYINQRICYLNDLLALPLGKLYISQCDENQKRQISFAIAILHEPELLLLDEPCQGVDPVCRTNIWDHLKTLVEKGVTVFLTTQHLPDANRADRLGILRNGYLLMEGSPAELINDYKENSIETLYTNIYSLRIKKGKLDEKKSIHEHPRVKLERITSHGSEGFLYVEEPGDTNATQNKKQNNKKAPVGFHCPLKFLPNCKRLATLLSRDIRLSFRCYTWLLTVCLVPIILLVLFTFTVGEHPKNLKIGVVNFETHEDCSRQNVSEKYVSCQVLGQIDKNIIQTTDYKKYDDAKSDAYNMKISAILVIGEKFTTQLVRMLAGVVNNKVLEQGNPNTPQLVLQMDMTNKVVATTIERAIKRAVEKYLQMATKQSTVQNATVGYPMVVSINTKLGKLFGFANFRYSQVGKPIFGDENSADTEFICLALTVVFLYYLASFLAATTMVSYRVGHLAVRDYVAGDIFLAI
ncbi:atp-binding cassette sub-family h member 1 [Holotrichia oblita]|uniref:Atp-binding cassette sub-family h member 1 n=1 Tax=Holotrichia oblita TaxID=644536 RepID=A0ACB9T1R4_HOLOL|nr:atp-binding cassette sub-family h member 1 [Holotrichia oblita]